MKKFPSRTFFLAVTILLVGSFTVFVSSLENNTISTDYFNKELILTDKEKVSLKEFKAATFDSIPKNLTLMRDDLFFIRFLRSKRGDVELSKRELFNFVKYINDEKINLIPGEDWKDMELENPFYFDAVDREGRPVGYMTMEGGGWNMRKAILQGKIKRMIRYMQKSVLEMNDKLVEAQAKDPRITQVDLILDFNGFNLIQHGCPLCVTTFIQLLKIYEKWIPNYAKSIVIINAPQSLFVFTQTFRSVLSQDVRAAIKFFNQDKNLWKAYVDERIDPAQLPAFLGGLRSNPE